MHQLKIDVSPVDWKYKVLQETSLGFMFCEACCTFCSTIRELQFRWFTDFEQKIIKAVIDLIKTVKICCVSVVVVSCCASNEHPFWSIDSFHNHTNSNKLYCVQQRISRISSFTLSAHFLSIFSTFYNVHSLFCQCTLERDTINTIVN